MIYQKMCLQVIFISSICILYNVLHLLRQEGKFHYLHDLINWGEFWILQLQGNFPEESIF